MRRMAFAMAAGMLLVTGTGCGTMVKRTLAEAKGASSKADPIPGTGGASFARFGTVNIETPRTELGGLVPSEFNSMLVSELRKTLTQGKDPVFKGGSPALTIEPHVMWFNKSGSAFPHKYAVVLFYFKGDGADLGKLQIVTKSEASGTGADDLAEDMAKELAGYFEKHGKKAEKKKD
ncbi:MAG: hypothetical protein AABZ08_12340 [Planctomycetota bacterium]